MRKSVDFWFSLGLTVFGAAVIEESWRMPRLAELGVHPMSAPGLTPGLLGVVLTALGMAQLLREAHRAPSDALPDAPEEQDAGAGGWRPLAVTSVLCFGYAAGLVGRVPFWLATLLFVAAFSLWFTRSWSQPRAALVSLVLAGLTAVSVTYLFQDIFLVRLP